MSEDTVLADGYLAVRWEGSGARGQTQALRGVAALPQTSVTVPWDGFEKSLWLWVLIN